MSADWNWYHGTGSSSMERYRAGGGGSAWVRGGYRVLAIVTQRTLVGGWVGGEWGGVGGGCGRYRVAQADACLGAVWHWYRGTGSSSTVPRYRAGGGGSMGVRRVPSACNRYTKDTGGWGGVVVGTGTCDNACLRTVPTPCGTVEPWNRFPRGAHGASAVDPRYDPTNGALDRSHFLR